MTSCICNLILDLELLLGFGIGIIRVTHGISAELQNDGAARDGDLTHGASFSERNIMKRKMSEMVSVVYYLIWIAVGILEIVEHFHP